MRYTFDGDVADIAGVNAALLYETIRYWCEENKKKNSNHKNGKYWMYCPAKSFTERYSFMSHYAVVKALNDLKKVGLIETGCFNKFGIDRTTWYTWNPVDSLDLSKLRKSETPKIANSTIHVSSFDKCDLSKSNKCDLSSFEQPIPITKQLPNKVQKTITKESEEESLSLADQVIDLLNERTGSRYRHTATSRKHIVARINDGFKLDDFEYVINVKSNEWLQDPKMSKFLRPETLFGSHFENYLSQLPNTPQQKQDKRPAYEILQDIIRKGQNNAEN